MGKPEQFTAKQFIDAIPGSAGIVTTIAKRVGCSWHTCKKYIETYPTIRDAYQDECESLTDYAESKLIEAIKAGDLAAVKYYLSTKGKNRGYSERQEVTGKDGGPVELAIVERIVEPEHGSTDEPGTV